MKKLYYLLLAGSLLFLSNCSKDFLKSYDDRIIGTWHIDHVNKIGFGGDTDNLPFKEGNFNFMKDGTMTYTDASGNVYKGTWDIQKKTINDNNGDASVFRSLQITAVNFTSQEVVSEYYDDISFVGTDYIRAKIFSPYRTYITHLRR
jgi:hypothetical protein